MVDKDSLVSAVAALYQEASTARVQAIYSPAVRFESWLPGDVIRVAGPHAAASAAGDIASSLPEAVVRPDIGVAAQSPDACHQHLFVGDESVDQHIIIPWKPEPPNQLGPLVPSILESARERTVLDHNGTTHVGLERAVLDDGRRVIVKRSSPENDFFVRGTNDVGREARLWLDGKFDGVESELRYPVIDAGFDDSGGWAVAMEDLSDHLATRQDYGVDEMLRLLSAMLPFYEKHTRGPKPAYVMSLSERLHMFSPRSYGRERESADRGPRMIAIGGERFVEYLPRELASAVEAVWADPESLEQELVAKEATILHGDLNRRNLAFRPGRIDVFDWQLSTWGPPDIDALWLLALAHSDAPPGVQDAFVERWKQLRGDTFDEAVFQRAIVATVCTHGFGWAMFGLVFGSRRSRASLEWWIPRFASALEHWSPI